MKVGDLRRDTGNDELCIILSINNEKQCELMWFGLAPWSLANAGFGYRNVVEYESLKNRTKKASK